MKPVLQTDVCKTKGKTYFEATTCPFACFLAVKTFHFSKMIKMDKWLTNLWFSKSNLL